MQVKRIIFREVGSYSDIPIRPYQASDYSSHAGLRLAEVTEGGRVITPETVAGVAGLILRPGAGIEGVSKVANGWGTRRFMFVMEVDIRTNMTSVDTQVITGYTDSDLGITGSEAIDEDMMLYFNSTYKVRSRVVMGSRGAENLSSVTDPVQLLGRRVTPDIHSSQSGSITMRPRDVLLSRTEVPEFEELGYEEGYMDMRHSMSSALKPSRRSNVLSTQYLARLSKAVVDSTPNDFVDSDNEERILNDAIGKLKEPTLNGDPLWDELRNDSNIMSSGYVTWGELLTMCPHLNRVKQVFFEDSRDRNHCRGDSADWGGSDLEEVIATMVGQAMPSFLMDTMYSVAKLIATNETPDHEWEITAPRLDPFMEGGQIIDNYERLINRMRFELLPDLLIQPDMDLYLEVTCAIYGDTKVLVSVGGGPELLFVYPTFCDSLVSPIVSDSKDTLRSLAQDVVSVLNEASVQGTKHRHQSIITDPHDLLMRPEAAPQRPRRGRL